MASLHLVHKVSDWQEYIYQFFNIKNRDNEKLVTANGPKENKKWGIYFVLFCLFV